MDAPHLYVDPSDLYPACAHYMPLANVFHACRCCGQHEELHAPCPDCGGAEFKWGQVLGRDRDTGLIQLVDEPQCAQCGHSRRYSGFLWWRIHITHTLRM